ncbi:ubiquitin carboxyl-terminal hydrolase MINDY-1-like isoform X1 [Salvia splendens]|uniref:ubiquitin carboxyl-terminal hydrolase MINDY-1-like isoform X1 n=1 Tax=Salvia splendens TaxID=180675 RepID=UPI001C273668|nr:ubiquitin carboxyl-terminal hydrolase MINDY-1-like isoform X1 [Salvia splendens]
MDSSSTLPPSTSATPPLTSLEEVVYKTKVIEFFDRTAPIILQNNNGPCPLLSICNVLSLKNSLSLSLDTPEVSQDKLLSLVADRLINSNSKIDNKDAGYVKNQQQNITDAIDLLPRLTTGIDVNIKFRRIDDFEFTPECAIFDLLDIPLYHGWIVDPQDIETADAIGSKSYNSLMSELVSLETQAMECEENENLEEDSVDFVAATTAVLGIPSPSLSRSQSFTDSPRSMKKGDMEEEGEVLRVLKLSETEMLSSAMAGVAVDTDSEHMGKSEVLICSEPVGNHVSGETVKDGALISNDSDNFVHDDEFKRSCGSAVDEPGNSEHVDETLSLEEVPSSSSHCHDEPRNSEHVENKFTSTSDQDEQSNCTNDCTAGELPSFLTASADLGSSSGPVHNTFSPVLNSGIDVSEPMYEGEECIMESGTAVCQNQEPIYEGEMVLAKQGDSGCVNEGDSMERISITQGELIRNFMKNSASQLTIYGLFCLLDKVKERELCVFFRNNHFNTMFKYEGDLYILATDQGYINQPDLVWEKLNEVNGDTVYVMGNFKDFKMDDPSNVTWDEQNAMSCTADYIASIDCVAQSNSNINSDLQLAIALQQQEFEQQQPQRSVHPTVASDSGLATDPQVSHNSWKHTPSSTKQESKSKEKCAIM